MQNIEMFVFTRTSMAICLLVCSAMLSCMALAEAKGVDADAAAYLRTSTSYLAAQTRFVTDAHSTIEVVLQSGQKLQLHHNVRLTLQRPNKLRVERAGDLVDQVFYYDGQSLTLYNPDDNYYATLPAPDTLEGMLDFARESLDIVAPAGDLVYTDAFDILMEDVTSGFVVGRSLIDGVPCVHLAFRSPHADWQIWIQEGTSPLPRRMVITSLDVLNAPQFTVEMANWDLAPVISEQIFAFEPPPGARSIDFLLQDRDAASGQSAARSQ